MLGNTWSSLYIPCIPYNAAPLEDYFADIGKVSRIDYFAKSAYVHFEGEEWYDTAVAEAMFCHINTCGSYLHALPQGGKYIICRRNLSPVPVYTGILTVDELAFGIESINAYLEIGGIPPVVKPKRIQFDPFHIEYFVPPSSIPPPYRGTLNHDQLAHEFRIILARLPTKEEDC